MTAPLPVIFVLSINRDLGGAEKSLAALLPPLKERARLVVFATNERHRADLETLAGEGLALIPLPLLRSPLSIVQALFRVWREARRRAPAALLANGHRGSLLLFLLRWLPLRGRPRFAVYVRDFAYTALRYTLWGMRDFLFLAPSAAIFEHPRYRAWGLATRRHLVLPNAALQPDQPKLPAPAEPRFIGCCARLVPWKGLEFLIEAFARIAKAHPEARVRIHGEPIDREYAASLVTLAARLGVAKQIEFHPFAADMDGVYRQGLFFVIPSRSILPGPESFSRIIIEAWSHARPVIAFACGGPRFLIEDGRDGYLVEERNTAWLAKRMAALLDDPALAERLGQAGAEKVRAQYSPPAIAQRLFELLTEGHAADVPTSSFRERILRRFRGCCGRRGRGAGQISA